MKRLLVLGLLALSSCGPTNVNVEPGAIVIQALRDPSPAAQASPSPTPIATPTPTPSPSACPQGWTHTGGNCLSPLQDGVATQQEAINSCAALSITLITRFGVNAAALCDTARLLNSPIQQNTYLWTSIQQVGGTAILLINGTTWAAGSALGQPALVPYYCCSAPN